jgi:hypothetical protein
MSGKCDCTAECCPCRVCQPVQSQDCSCALGLCNLHKPVDFEFNLTKSTKEVKNGL